MVPQSEPQISVPRSRVGLRGGYLNSNWKKNKIEGKWELKLKQKIQSSKLKTYEFQYLHLHPIFKSGPYIITFSIKINLDK